MPQKQSQHTQRRSQFLILAIVGFPIVAFQNCSSSVVNQTRLLTSATRAQAASTEDPILTLGTEYPGAQGSLLVLPVVSGASRQELKYNFYQGGNYVASTAKLATAARGTYVRLRVRADLNLTLGLRILDSSGQTLQFHLDRSSKTLDIDGFTTLTQSISKSSDHWGGANSGTLNGSVTQLSVLIDKPKMGSLLGAAYIQDLELMNSAPSSDLAVRPAVPLAIASYIFSNGPEFPGAKGSLSVSSVSASTPTETLFYNFSGGGAYIGVTNTISSPAPAHWLTLRGRADAGLLLGARIVDQSGQTLQYNLDRTSLPLDDEGWQTITQSLDDPNLHWGGLNNGSVNGSIKSVAILINKPKALSASLAGSADFAHIELSDTSPSLTRTLDLENPVIPRSVGFYTGGGGSLGTVIATPLLDGDVLQTFNYDFSTLGQYVSDLIGLTAPLNGNTVRFLAKVPAGMILDLQLIDSTGQTVVFHTARALSQLGDKGFTPYVVRIGSSASHWGGVNDGVVHQPVVRMAIVIESSHTLIDVQPKSQVLIKNFHINDESDVLDLSPDSPTVTPANLRARGTDPMSAMGVCIHKADPKAYSIAREMGFKSVRFDLKWANVEQTRGVYNFTDYDNQIALAENYSLIPNVILDYNNTLYANTKTSAVSTQANLLAFENFAKAVAQHYKSHTIIYEIWNEANRYQNWAPAADANEFAALVAGATKAIRSVDQKNKILSGGTSQIDFNAIKGLIDNGAANVVSGIAVHPYAQNLNEWRAATEVAANQMIAAAGAKTRLWITENGASSSWYGSGDQDTPRFMQAVYLARGMLSGWATGAPLLTVYELRDEVTEPAPLDAESNFGLIDYLYQPKPAKVAAQNLFAATSGRSYQGVISGNPSTLQAMKFSGVGKETVFIAWEAFLGKSSVITVPNSCNSKLTLSGSTSNTHVPCVTDIIGRSVFCTPTANGRMACPVSENGGPIFIRMAAAGGAS